MLSEGGHGSLQLPLAVIVFAHCLAPLAYISAMKVQLPEISWHANDAGKNDPILGCAWGPDQVLATAGADGDVSLWKITGTEGADAAIDHIVSLNRHSKPVNCVKFSPCGM